MKVKKHGINMQKLFEPTKKWGPAKTDDRINYQHEREDDIDYTPSPASSQEEESTMLSKI